MFKSSRCQRWRRGNKEGRVVLAAIAMEINAGNGEWGWSICLINKLAPYVINSV
jgi:hypothetical protein